MIIEANFTSHPKIMSVQLYIANEVLVFTNSKKNDYKDRAHFLTNPYFHDANHEPLIMCCAIMTDGGMEAGDIANYFGIPTEQVKKYLIRHKRIMEFDSVYRTQLARTMSSVQRFLSATKNIKHGN